MPAPPTDREPCHLVAILRAACLLEAAAPKPGNVHPGAAFADLSYADFVASAEASAPHLALAGRTGVGAAILAAIEATTRVVRSNTNLGMALLLAPLAAVDENLPLAAGICDVLQRLTQHDAALAYRAIRLAHPGGLGRVPHEDVWQEPQVGLLAAMQLAADRDLIAAQYAGNFSLVLTTGIDFLAGFKDFASAWQYAIVGLALTLHATHADSLIARKCGGAVAAEASRRAGAVLAAGWPGAPAGHAALAEFDDWLRADGHRRNPGAIADLTAACLFAALREKRIALPEFVARPGE